MPQFLRNPVGLLALVAILLVACATTRLDAVWRDPSYQARPHKIMVIGVAKAQANRRVFEDEFVRQLNAHGTEAVASYTVLPEMQQDSRAAIAAKVTELGADTVLITRMVGKKTEQFYVPGTAYYPPPYYGYGYQAMYTPGYMAEEEFAVVETNLYEARTNKLVWAVSSETEMHRPNRERIKSYIEVMMKTMAEHRLLGK